MVHGNLVHGKRLFLILRPNTVRYVIFLSCTCGASGSPFLSARWMRRAIASERTRLSAPRLRSEKTRDCGAKGNSCGSLLQRPKRHWQFTGPATSQKTLANALAKRRAPASQKIGLLRWSKDAHPSSVAPALLCFDWHVQRRASPPAARITSCAATAARKRLRRDWALNN